MRSIDAGPGMKIYFVLALAILLNAGANILIKIAMQKSPILIEQGTVFSSLLQAVKNPWLLLGVSCFGLALVAYSAVLSKINLSIAYPVMTGAGFLIVFIVSALYLKEQLTHQHIMGALLILAGVWLLAGRN
ncbi:permiase [Desulfocucumis palustris]|uniref:Permiase n=1 Tax=Desulfocucumis palustris TaxID=1898651 RepID=A0A2L2XHA2_9FIRM|nr:SMR family transporter [Desulfocucumis palustris]GBF35364.1 permiase [Desulfocucumis palustris]